MRKRWKKLWRRKRGGGRRAPIDRAGQRGQLSGRARDRRIGADVYYSAHVSLGAWAHGQLRSGRQSDSEALTQNQIPCNWLPDLPKSGRARWHIMWGKRSQKLLLPDLLEVLKRSLPRFVSSPNTGPQGGLRCVIVWAFFWYVGLDSLSLYVSVRMCGSKSSIVLHV